MVDVSRMKMFPALVTTDCAGLVNLSSTVKTSVPSILLSLEKIMPTCVVAGESGDAVSVTLRLHPVSVKSFRSIKREFHSHQLHSRKLCSRSKGAY